MNYYNVPAISASGINAFWRSPLHYWIESPFNTDKKAREDTPAMLFGRVCHALILEPLTFSRAFNVKPKDMDRRTKLGKIQFNEYLDRIALQTAKATITYDQHIHALEMAAAISNNTACHALLKGGQAEHEIYWKHDDIECKAKLDYYRYGIVIDYKTVLSANPRDFKKSIVNFGYHRQAAWYMKAAEEQYGERPKGFVFIIQEKGLPEAIGIYALDADAIDIGAYECQIAFDGIKRRLDSNEWEAYPQRIEEISLPAWYQTQSLDGEK